MATTQGYILGHNFRCFIDGVGAGHAESCQYSLTIDSKELSDKDVDPGSTEPSAVALTLGKKRIEIKVTGFVVEAEIGGGASSGGYKDILTKALDGTKVEWLFGTNNAGDTELTGEGYITNFDGSGDDASEAKYSFTVKSTGTFGMAETT